MYSNVIKRNEVHHIEYLGGFFMRIPVLALLAVLAWRVPRIHDDAIALRAHDLDGAVSAAASLCLIAGCIYLLAVIIASWRAQHGKRWAVLVQRCAPAALRIGIVTVMAAGIAQPAGAMDGPHDLHGLEFPDRPVSPRPHTGEQESAQHTVRGGESLWSIAAGSLPADATNSAVARSWRAWWQTNRKVIGADPDVIHPGQVLQAPDHQ